jgi:AcrR family transcriptional regulator/predicted DNA-binding transcriptional regulator AlpA
MIREADDLDQLIDAQEVATILGLAHRNSVSTYRTRYADFPSGQPAPGGGRSRLWVRGEIVAWHEKFRHRQARTREEPSERLEVLVAATTRLLLANPGSDISIREIATEAGVAHSDLYRHAESKEQLVGLAVKRVEESFRTAFPDDLDTFRAHLPELLAKIRAARPAMMVVVDRALLGESPSSDQELAVTALMALIVRDRAKKMQTSAVEPGVLAAAVSAMIWGLVILEPRWQEALELDGMPLDQVATIISAMLDT